ncbi:hypothetical protein SVAN01_07510 [Stagonosporopsis vannaccii]|nr:hypothetical protein SVAN01_07510 [Stagonosporopsis vannaccii]
MHTPPTTSRTSISHAPCAHNRQPSVEPEPPLLEPPLSRRRCVLNGKLISTPRVPANQRALSAARLSSLSQPPS